MNNIYIPHLKWGVTNLILRILPNNEWDKKKKKIEEKG